MIRDTFNVFKEIQSYEKKKTKKMVKSEIPRLIII